MDSLAGYVASVCVGAIGSYLSQFLRPTVKIRYWTSHNFTYTIPKIAIAPTPALAPNAAGLQSQTGPQNFFLLTQSLTVQNFGRERAEWVEIVHQQRPDHFQLYPPLNHTETVGAAGEHTIRVQSLASKEFFTVQFLFYTHAPNLSLVRSSAGMASTMPWMIVRKLPTWVYTLMYIAMIIGAGFCAYWLIRGGHFVLSNSAAT